MLESRSQIDHLGAGIDFQQRAAEVKAAGFSQLNIQNGTILEFHWGGWDNWVSIWGNPPPSWKAGKFIRR